MTLRSVVAQITFDTENPPNLDAVADNLANWEGVRRVRVRPSGQPNTAPTMRRTANSRFKDLYTEDQFLRHEEEMAALERGDSDELDPDIPTPTGGTPEDAGPPSGPVTPLPDDAKPSRSKRA